MDQLVELSLKMIASHWRALYRHRRTRFSRVRDSSTRLRDWLSQARRQKLRQGMFG